MFDLLMEKLGKLKDRAKHVPRPPSFFHAAQWFGDIFEPINAVMTLLLETIDRDCERTLRINLAAKLEQLLQELDDLLHRIAAAWEHTGEQQTKAN